MPTHLDRSSVTGTGPHSCRLVSLLSRVDWSLASPFANNQLRAPLSNSLLASPYHFRSRRDLKSKTLCLVLRQNRQRNRLLTDHLHSVTPSRGNRHYLHLLPHNLLHSINHSQIATTGLCLAVGGTYNRLMGSSADECSPFPAKKCVLSMTLTSSQELHCHYALVHSDPKW